MAPSPQQSIGIGTNAYVEIVPLTLHIGAEIRGVDLSKPLPAEQLKEVRDAVQGKGCAAAEDLAIHL